MDEYTKHDIAKLIDRPHRTITYWTDIGLVHPDIQPSEGKGKARIYSETNLIEFAMIDLMVKKIGVSLPLCQQIFFVFHLRPIDEQDLLPIIDKCIKSSHEKGNQFSINLFETMKKTIDFFDNPEWGLSKELVVVGTIHEDSRELSDDSSIVMMNALTPKREIEKLKEKQVSQFGQPYYYILDLNEKGYSQFLDEMNNLFTDTSCIMNSHIFLGKIKNAAMKNVGLKP